MLIPHYTLQDEEELVGGLDKLIRKVKKKSRKLSYPDRRSPYAIGINDSLMVIGPPRGGLYGQSTEVVPTVPISYERSEVESIPSTPVHRKSEMPDISSISETGVQSPMVRPALSQMKHFQEEEERLKGEIDFLERDLRGTPTDTERDQWSRELTQRLEEMDTLQTDMKRLKKNMNKDDKHLLKQLQEHQRAQRAVEEAEKLKAENEKLGQQAELGRAELELNQAVDRAYEVFDKNKDQYIYYNAETGETIPLGGNKKNVPDKLQLAGKGAISIKDLKTSGLSTGWRGFFIVKPENSTASEIKGHLRPIIEKRRKM